MIDTVLLKAKLLINRRINNNGCWVWTKGRTGNGYGQVHINRRGTPVHRVSHELFIGPIAPGLLVCHKCDNPLCFNPDHLFAGTQQANIQDAFAKGRLASKAGELNFTAKLKTLDVHEIRRLIEQGASQSGLARRYGVSRQTIGRIKRNETWRSLPIGA